MGLTTFRPSADDAFMSTAISQTFGLLHFKRAFPLRQAVQVGGKWEHPQYLMLHPTLQLASTLSFALKMSPLPIFVISHASTPLFTSIPCFSASYLRLNTG